jgi:hypothetical protein
MSSSPQEFQAFHEALMHSPHARCQEIEDLCPECRAACERYAAKWASLGEHLDALACIGALLTVNRAEDDRRRALAWLADYVVRHVSPLPAEAPISSLEPEILLTVGDLTQPQYIRLGRQWITDDDGKKRLIPPGRLPLGDALRWFLYTVRNRVQRLGTPEPLPHAEGNQLSMESMIEGLDLLQHLVAPLAGPQQTLLGLLLDHASPAEIQQDMGLTPTNYWQRLHRLRAQVRALLSAS